MSKESLMTNYISDRVDEFIKEINGMYREHISDRLLATMLKYSIYKAHKADNRPFNTNIVYGATVFLFETQLERGCGIHKNGHHTSQLLCKFFDNTKLKEE